MAQEFTIKSQQIEDKINQLLPSQGGFQAGVDFSASTMVIPIVDLTETAEGSSLRQDLQTAMSLTASTSFSVQNSSATLINTTGYYRIFGISAHAAQSTTTIAITDGTTTKNLFSSLGATGQISNVLVDFIVFLEAGDSIIADTNNANAVLSGNTRQIADISGNLVNP